MATYALIKDGAFANTVEAEADWIPPTGYSKEPFNPAVHFFAQVEQPTSVLVSTNRFQFGLHTLQQQTMMDAVHTASLLLTPAQIMDFTPGAMDAHGWPLDIMRVFRLFYERMASLGAQQIDLLSPEVEQFLQAAAALGIYGEDPTAELARIKSDAAP